jgi:hypothetical protein
MAGGEGGGADDCKGGERMAVGRRCRANGGRMAGHDCEGGGADDCKGGERMAVGRRCCANGGRMAAGDNCEDGAGRRMTRRGGRRRT